MIAILYPNPDDRALSLAILRQSTNLGCIVGATGFGQVYFSLCPHLWSWTDEIGSCSATRLVSLPALLVERQSGSWSEQ
jgi:hypothetical protein